MSRSNIPVPLFERGEESQRLERGTAVCRFQSRTRPEGGNLSVRRETGHLIWQTNQSKIVLLSLLEIKNIVAGKNTKDFEKWPDECSRYDSSKCFVLYYTSEFKYKTLSVAALSERERQDWLEGIPYLVKEAKAAGHVTQLERLLRTLFYTVQNQDYRAGVRELRQLITRLHFNEREQRVRSLIRKVDEAEREEINFDQFCELIKMLMWEEQRKLLDKSVLAQYCSGDGNTCTLALFEAFLSDQQMQDHSQAADMMREAIDDRERDVAQPSFRADEFLQYLFSKENEIWDDKYNTEFQDMTRPLSHYFISSSHNTYLVGKQMGDESSVEAYVRALRMGCRCIELDTWPERDGKIYIYHGYAFTTKILLEDVLHAIRTHAFVTSPYPVILSIEDHCTPPHQREMARLLREVFGSMLVTEPLERGETVAPALHLLKGRIIIKHKKQQPDGVTDGWGAAGGGCTVATQDEGTVAAIRRGLLYRRHPVSQHLWQKHYFMLSDTRLYYTHACEDADGDQDMAMAEFSVSLPAESRHLNEPWYHGGSTITRAAAEELLSRHSSLGDGTFLVRRSENFVGDFTLSFWCAKG